MRQLLPETSASPGVGLIRGGGQAPARRESHFAARELAVKGARVGLKGSVAVMSAFSWALALQGHPLMGSALAAGVGLLLCGAAFKLGSKSRGGRS